MAGTNARFLTRDGVACVCYKTKKEQCTLCCGKEATPLALKAGGSNDW